MRFVCILWGVACNGESEWTAAVKMQGPIKRRGHKKAASNSNSASGKERNPFE